MGRYEIIPIYIKLEGFPSKVLAHVDGIAFFDKVIGLGCDTGWSGEGQKHRLLSVTNVYIGESSVNPYHTHITAAIRQQK